MKIFCKTVDGIYVPPRPSRDATTSKMNAWKTYTFKSPSGLDVYYTILKSKNEAKQLIMGLLSSSGFPMVIGGYYKNNPDEYVDDMLEYKNSHQVWVDEFDGESLCVKADARFICFDHYDYDEAITAFNLHDIQELEYTDATGGAIYNGWIVWDQWGDDLEDGSWRICMGDFPSTYLDGTVNDYEWKDINGTYIMLPPWAKSFKEFMK